MLEGSVAVQESLKYLEFCKKQLELMEFSEEEKNKIMEVIRRSFYLFKETKRISGSVFFEWFPELSGGNKKILSFFYNFDTINLAEINFLLILEKFFNFNLEDKIWKKANLIYWKNKALFYNQRNIPARRLVFFDGYVFLLKMRKIWEQYDVEFEDIVKCAAVIDYIIQKVKKESSFKNLFEKIELEDFFRIYLEIKKLFPKSENLVQSSLLKRSKNLESYLKKVDSRVKDVEQKASQFFKIDSCFFKKHFSKAHKVNKIK